MNIDELQEVGVDVFDISENELFPFSKTWKKTFEAIEKSLKELNNEPEKERILQKVSNIVNVLVRFGTTYEDIVLEIAELYVFSREANIDPKFFEKAYGKGVVESVICLNNALDTDEKRKAVFENEKHRYLGKIKIADYLVEIADNPKISKEYKLEIDEVIKHYKERSHKALMRMLIAERKRIK